MLLAIRPHDTSICLHAHDSAHYYPLSLATIVTQYDTLERRPCYDVYALTDPCTVHGPRGRSGAMVMSDLDRYLETLNYCLEQYNICTADRKEFWATLVEVASATVSMELMS